MERSKIEKIIHLYKIKVEERIARGKYNEALYLISACADFLYTFNLYYRDDELEEAIHKISTSIFPQKLTIHNSKTINNRILFYDGFGLNMRGLARIYINALVKKYKVDYVTYEDRANEVPDIIKTVKKNGGSVYFIKCCKPFNMIGELNDVLKSSGSRKFIFYSYPNDVVATTFMSAYKGILTRYQINLTDHAFWLGESFIDVCIEFRDYGASISKKYREIPEDRIVKLPYYPFIPKGQKFQGFPFEVKEGQKVVFSGGALYKTFGDGNKYYKIVEYILSVHKEVVFWYAGTGDDSELKKLMAKYPGRVFHTDERADLFEVLKHCCFYLSTYPVYGGLMFQYAAAVGIIPVTLRRNDWIGGFNPDQEKICFFDTEESIRNEIDHLLNDEKYRSLQERKISKTVISEDTFTKELLSIIENQCSSFEIQFSDIDTQKFRNNYLLSMSEKFFSKKIARRKCLCIAFRNFPFLTCEGIVLKVLSKIKSLLS